jgi:hypothetical protein
MTLSHPPTLWTTKMSRIHLSPNKLVHRKMSVHPGLLQVSRLPHTNTNSLLHTLSLLPKEYPMSTLSINTVFLILFFFNYF